MGFKPVLAAASFMLAMGFLNRLLQLFLPATQATWISVTAGASFAAYSTIAKASQRRSDSLELIFWREWCETPARVHFAIIVLSLGGSWLIEPFLRLLQSLLAHPTEKVRPAVPERLNTTVAYE